MTLYTCINLQDTLHMLKVLINYTERVIRFTCCFSHFSNLGLVSFCTMLPFILQNSLCLRPEWLLKTSRVCNCWIIFSRSFSWEIRVCFPEARRTCEIWSNCLHMLNIGPTDLPIRTIAFGERFEPCWPITDFTVWFKCSLWRSHGLLAPGLPLLLTNLDQINCSRCLGGSNSALARSVTASKEYFVLLEDLKTNRKNLQQRRTLSPSPSSMASSNSAQSRLKVRSSRAYANTPSTLLKLGCSCYTTGCK